MKKTISFLVFLFMVINVYGQSYYKVIRVLNENLQPFSENSSEYSSNIGRHLILHHTEMGLMYKYHNSLGADMLQFAGVDNNTGNRMYARMYMGQANFYDVNGHYYFLQFENGTNNMIIASGGIVNECTPVTQKEYMDYVSLVGVAPITNHSYSTDPIISSDTPSKSYTPKYVKSMETCTTCKGTGKSLTRKSAPSYGAKTKVYCEICDSYGNSHYHDPCPVCKGTRVVERMVKK